MSTIYTEKDYPIRRIWTLKPILIVIVIIIILGSFILVEITRVVAGTSETYRFVIMPGLLLIAFSYPYVYVILLRIMFYYSFEDKSIKLKQGIFKKEQRTTPYGVIQSVVIRRDWFDQLFKLASIVISDATRGEGGDFGEGQRFFGIYPGTVGFSGNNIIIPGLAKQDADKLKELILKRMKENPIDDSRSGL